MRRFAAFLLFLAGCVSVPSGPSVLTLPGQGKGYDEFRADEYECRAYAQSLVGTSADQAAADAGARSVALGAAIGALAGAATGRGEAAVAGAGIGAAGGAVAGTGAAAQSASALQQRYDNGYIQCMYAKGNQVPMAGRYAAIPGRAAPQAAPSIPPPPPPGFPPPPNR